MPNQAHSGPVERTATQHRVALVVASFYPHEGGAERQLREVTTQLAGRGADLVVVTRARRGLQHSDRIDGLSLRRVPPIATSEPSRWRALVFAISAFSTLSLQRPALVVGSQLGSATAAAATYCRIRGFPLIVRISAAAGSETLAAANSSRRRPGGPSGESLLLRYIFSYKRTYVVAPSEHMLHDVLASRRISEDRVRIIENGVEVAPESTHPSPTAHGVIWYGRNDPLKNIPAFLELVAALPHANFLAVGRVTLPSAPNLQALGWVDDLQSIMAARRVAVSTSVSEGSPNFLLLAAGLGLRIVGFENAAMLALQRQMPDRIITVPQGDGNALADAVAKSLVATPLGRAQIASIDEVAQRWLSLFTEATGEPAVSFGVGRGLDQAGRPSTHIESERPDGS